MVIARLEVFDGSMLSCLKVFMYDGEFDESAIDMRDNGDLLVIPFTQLLHDLAKHRGKRNWFRRRDVPRCGCRLLFRTAREYRITRERPCEPTHHSIGDLIYDLESRIFTIQTHEGVAIDIVADTLDIILELTDEEVIV